MADGELWHDKKITSSAAGSSNSKDQYIQRSIQARKHRVLIAVSMNIQGSTAHGMFL
jgi:hypothetical protein